MSIIKYFIVSTFLLSNVVFGQVPENKNHTPAKKVARGNAQFAFELYKALSTKDLNCVISPYSVSSCMGMVSIAATGDTLEQIRQVLHFPKQPMITDFGFRALNESMKTGMAAETEPVHLNPTNTIWTQKGVMVSPPIYTKIMHFYEGLQQADFINDSEGSRELINAYVEEKTVGMIKGFLPQGTIDSNTRMVAVNTLYLSAPWATPFNERRTREGTFYGQESETVVPYMYRTDFMQLVQNDQFSMVEIPFTASLSTDTELSLYIILPNEGVTLEAIEADWSAETFRQNRKKMDSYFVALQFPKFDLDCTAFLKPTLMQMGLTLPFVPEGGFPYGKEGDEKMILTEVVHTVKAEFNEWGATCAAATGAIMGLTSFPGGDDEEIPFVCDHPFLFVLADKNTKSILFMGKLAQPD